LFRHWHSDLCAAALCRDADRHRPPAQLRSPRVFVVDGVLGYDVGGWPELNMWQVMRAAIEVQKARSAYEPNLRPLRPSEAFYLRSEERRVGKACENQ